MTKPWKAALPGAAVFMFFYMVTPLIAPVQTAYGRSLAEIQKTKEIRICLAGSNQDFYKKNAEAFAEFLVEDIEKTCPINAKC